MPVLEYIFLIPESLDIDALLESNPPDFENFKIEKVLEVVDTISRIVAQNPDYGDDFDGYVPINAEVLRTRIGNRYHEYLKYLVNTGVLETNNYFSRELHISRKYRFTETYNVQLKEYKANISSWLARKVTPANSLIESVNLSELDAELQEVLPISAQELTLQQELKFGQLMRLKRPYAFKWYDEGGLEVDFSGASNINKILLRLRKNGLAPIEARWNRKEKMFFKKHPLNQQRATAYNLKDLKYKQYKARFDPNVFRQYSVLTHLNKAFRPFITWKGQKLVSIDIKNSQPFLLASILNPNFWSNTETQVISFNKLEYNSNYISQYPIPNIITLCNFYQETNPQDYREYIEAVSSGRFYEAMSERLPQRSGKVLTRVMVKELMFKVLFTDNADIDENWAKAKRDFRDNFPSINAVIELIKQNGGKQLPLLLQRLESHIIYNHVLPEISRRYQDLPFFTIHDSVVTLSSMKDEVTSIMKQQIQSATGLIPTLDSEEWESNKIVEEYYYKKIENDILEDYYNEILKSSIC